MLVKRQGKFYVVKFALPWIYKGVTFRDVWNLRAFSKFVGKDKEDDYTEDSYRFVDGCQIQHQVNSIITKKALGNWGHVPYIVQRGYRNKLYYVMEYVEAQDLLEWSKKASKIAKLNFFHSVVGLVHYALHNHSIIHRDLKIDNLMVVDGAEPKPVLIDFGLAKNTSVQKQIQTSNNTRIGSPLFAPFEQLTKLSSTDFRSDIFMLGTLFWTIWAGEIPRVAKDRREILTIWEYFPPDVFPMELQHIYELCTKIEPIERYQEIGDLQRELEKVVLKDEPKVINRHVTNVFQAKPGKKVKGIRYYSKEEIAKHVVDDRHTEIIYNIVNGFIQLITKGSK